MWKYIELNKRKTVFTVFLLFILFLSFGTALGFYLFGTELIEGIVVVDAVFVIMLFVMLIQARSIALSSFDGGNLYKCEGNQYGKQLLNIVNEMQIASGLSKTPDVYILDSDMMNAFACAQDENHASIVVTKGLLEVLTRDELQGVIAHEMAHIVNRDSSYLLYASTIVTIICMVSYMFLRSGSRRSSRSSNGKNDGIILLVMLLFAILAPILSRMLFFCISRKREYLADACAAQFTRYPLALACALEKISSNVKNYNYKEEENSLTPFVEASLIVPMKLASERDGLFSTHPSTSNRIKILTEIAGIGNVSFDSYNKTYTRVTKKGSLFSKNLCKEIINSTPAMIPVVQSLNNTQDTNVQPKEKIKQNIEQHRQVEDLMWHLAEYIFIECPCKTKLKVPKSYKGSKIPCPHCGKVYDIN